MAREQQRDAPAVPTTGGPPREQPLGILLASTGKAVERAFDDALAAAGGSRPAWLVLLSVKSGAGRTQSAIADRLGLSGPTLTHHLDRLEADGLVTRTRDRDNRRIQTVTLTRDGEALFLRLREAAMAFDQRLRTGFADDDQRRLRLALAALQANIAAADAATSTRVDPPRSRPPDPA